VARMHGAPPHYDRDLPSTPSALCRTAPLPDGPFTGMQTTTPPNASIREVAPPRRPSRRNTTTPVIATGCVGLPCGRRGAASGRPPKSGPSRAHHQVLAHHRRLEAMIVRVPPRSTVGVPDGGRMKGAPARSPAPDRGLPPRRVRPSAPRAACRRSLAFEL